MVSLATFAGGPKTKGLACCKCLVQNGGMKCDYARRLVHGGQRREWNVGRVNVSTRPTLNNSQTHQHYSVEIRCKEYCPLKFYQAEAGTGISSAGTSVFTDTCGQVRPLKFSRTVWVYRSE